MSHLTFNNIKKELFTYGWLVSREKLPAKLWLLNPLRKLFWQHCDHSWRVHLRLDLHIMVPLV